MPTGDVLVTGATGHLGYHLIHVLNEAGVVPRVLLRRPLEPECWTGLRIRPYQADLTDPDVTPLESAVAGIDTVYHLASMVSLRRSETDRCDEVNRLGTVRLGEAAHRAGVRRIIFLSTAASVGASIGPHPLDEDSSWNLGALRIPYFQSKRAAERWLLEQARATPGFPEVVVANPSLMIGPPLAVGGRNRKDPSGLWPRPLPGGLRLYVDGRLNLVDVRDVARALWRLGERGRNGERYLLTGPALAISEVLDALGGHLPLARFRLRVPRRLLLWGTAVAAFLQGELIEGGGPHPPRQGQAGVARDLLRLLDYGWAYSTEKARREIGFAPTPFKDSLRDLLQWARTEAR